MKTLKQRIQPVLDGRLSVSELDAHTREALDIFIFFRASALLGLPKDQMKAEGEKLPECVKGLARAECKRLLKQRYLA